MTQQTQDSKIEQLLSVVSKQRTEIEEMEKALKRPWETNCSYQLSGNPTSIQTASVQTAHAIMTDLVLRHGASKEAAKILGLTEQSEAIQGYTFDQWTNDLKKRISKYGIDARKKKLDEAETRLNVLISPEKRREMELAMLEAELTI